MTLSAAARTELRDQISHALVAHHEWVMRIESAVRNGATNLDPDEVAAPDRCRIGRWLSGDISEELRETPLYKVTRGRHATFHREAAAVVRATVADEIEAAEAAIREDGAVGRAAHAIHEALDAWNGLAEERA